MMYGCCCATAIVVLVRCKPANLVPKHGKEQGEEEEEEEHRICPCCAQEHCSGLAGKHRFVEQDADVVLQRHVAEFVLVSGRDDPCSQVHPGGGEKHGSGGRKKGEEVGTLEWPSGVAVHSEDEICCACCGRGL